MGWATHYIEKLKEGETVSFRPRGKSMSGRIEPGQLCTVEPVDPGKIEAGDIVLCTVHGSEYLHIVKTISIDKKPAFGVMNKGTRFLIGNNHGRLNGWIGADNIFGRLKEVKS
jgi:hypothetical protein